MPQCDDARESGPRGEREESGAGCADERDRPEEPSMTVPARFRDRVGLLFDGLGRVQRPHREGDRLGGQGIRRGRRGRNGRRFLGDGRERRRDWPTALPRRVLPCDVRGVRLGR